jgi:rubrerythrin
MPDQKELDVLVKLADLERNVGMLYEAYAELFPRYREFWLGLAVEEKQHENWVHDLQSYVVQSGAKLNANRFNVIAIQSFIKYLNDESVKAKKREISLINALSVSKYIEESLIEHKFFEVAQGDSAELKQLLSGLANATQAHNEKIREALDAYKNTTDL